MLQSATMSPECEDSIFAFKNQEQYHQSLAKSSINLPDFEQSRVIATNKQIDARFEEEKPFQHFFMRMNELGYETNHVTNETIILQEDVSVKDSPFEEAENDNKSPMQFAEKEAKSFKEKDYKRRLGKTLQKMTEKIFEIDYERIQILDYIEDMKARMFAESRKYLIIWRELLITIQKSFQTAHMIERKKIAKLEDEIQEQTSKIEELEFSKQNVSRQEQRWKDKLDELEEEVRRLDLQNTNLETENQQLKYELGKFNEYEDKIRSYEEEIVSLQKNLQLSSEYIFDLQQKVENCNYQIAEKEKKMQIEHEVEIQQMRERIQQNYSVEFEKVQEQIRQKVMEQLCAQYQAYTTQVQELKRQLQDQTDLFQAQKQKYQNQLYMLSQEKKQLIEQNRQLEIKLHEMEQLQMKMRAKAKEEDRNRHQLQNKLRDMQEKYREREAQLNYYKSMKNRPIDQSRAIQPSHPNPNFRHKKPANILIMEDSILDKSILKESAISPSSAIQQKFGKSREDLINNILSRIKLRQQGSNISQLLENSYEQSEMKKTTPSTLRPHSPESNILEKEKDVRMKNISSKLEQLRSDIRRQIGMMKN